MAALLAHLAFWDQRVLVLLERWKDQETDSSPIDPGAVNDAMRPLCLALDPRVAASLCLSAATAVDTAIDLLDESMAKRFEEHAHASGSQFRLNRSIHRSDHLDQIEALLHRGLSGHAR